MYDLEFIVHGGELHPDEMFTIPITKRLTQIPVNLLETRKTVHNKGVNNNIVPAIVRIVETLAVSVLFAIFVKSGKRCDNDDAHSDMKYILFILFNTF